MESRPSTWPRFSAADCALFLWATMPMLAQALEVMEAWGFAHKSRVPWMKDQAGTGYWFRNPCETLLVGTRGESPAPAPGTQWSSGRSAPVREHSRKPEGFYELIGAYFPICPKIELFGWGHASRLEFVGETKRHERAPRRS